MNVLLFESHYRSRSWFLALKEVSKLHIVSVLKEERQLFLKQGIVESKILNLANFDSDAINLDSAIDYIKNYEKKYTKQELKKRLTHLQYHVTQEKGTER